MLTYDSAIAREIYAQIQDAVQRILEELSTGWSVKDFADYRYKVGQIDALKAVIEALPEAERKVHKR